MDEEKLTYEHGVGGGICRVEVFPDVSDQCHDHHWVDSEDVPDPAIQNPVLQNKPANITSAELTQETTRTEGFPGTSPNGHLSKEDAERSGGGGAAIHPPQLQDQGEVDERGNGRPGGVESQAVVDLHQHSSHHQQSGDQKMAAC